MTTYPPKDKFKHIFDKVEILWNTHTVLPPSLHNSGNTYEFINCKFPKSLPSGVPRHVLANFTNVYLQGDKVEAGFAYGRVLYEYMSNSKIPNDISEPDIQKYTKETIFCILDIETDGFPEKVYNSIKFPNVVQIAWLLMNADGIIIKKESELINYPNLQYTDAFEIHNIDIEVIKKIGLNPNDAYSKLIKDLRLAKYVVAHNTEFDLPILENQFHRYQLPSVLQGKETICTMKESAVYCHLEDKFGNYRYPSLVELYNKLFNYKIDQLHNAESDALITAKCFKELLDRSVISLK